MLPCSHRLWYPAEPTDPIAGPTDLVSLEKRLSLITHTHEHNKPSELIDLMIIVIQEGLLSPLTWARIINQTLAVPLLFLSIYTLIIWLWVLDIAYQSFPNEHIDSSELSGPFEPK